jgi:hypothetical protein
MATAPAPLSANAELKSSASKLAAFMSSRVAQVQQRVQQELDSSAALPSAVGELALSTDPRYWAHKLRYGLTYPGSNIEEAKKPIVTLSELENLRTVMRNHLSSLAEKERSSAYVGVMEEDELEALWADASAARGRGRGRVEQPNESSETTNEAPKPPPSAPGASSEVKQRSSGSWLFQFCEEKGLQSLSLLLDHLFNHLSLSESTYRDRMYNEILEMLELLLGDEFGIRSISQDIQLLKNITNGLEESSRDETVKSKVLQILTIVSVLSTTQTTSSTNSNTVGAGLIQTILEHHRGYNKLSGSRFKILIDLVSIANNYNPELKLDVMTLINTLLAPVVSSGNSSSGAGQRSLEQRVKLRNELLSLGILTKLQEVKEWLRAHQHVEEEVSDSTESTTKTEDNNKKSSIRSATNETYQALLDNIDLFEFQMIQDSNETAFGALDLSDAEQVFAYLYSKLKPQKLDFVLLSILHLLLTIPSVYESPEIAPQMWSTVQFIVHAATTASEEEDEDDEDADEDDDDPQKDPSLTHAPLTFAELKEMLTQHEQAVVVNSVADTQRLGEVEAELVELKKKLDQALKEKEQEKERASAAIARAKASSVAVTPAPVVASAPVAPTEEQIRSSASFLALQSELSSFKSTSQKEIQDLREQLASSAFMAASAVAAVAGSHVKDGPEHAPSPSVSPIDDGPARVNAELREQIEQLQKELEQAKAAATSASASASPPAPVAAAAVPVEESSAFKALRAENERLASEVAKLTAAAASASSVPTTPDAPPLAPPIAPPTAPPMSGSAPDAPPLAPPMVSSSSTWQISFASFVEITSHSTHSCLVSSFFRHPLLTHQLHHRWRHQW